MWLHGAERLSLPVHRPRDSGRLQYGRHVQAEGIRAGRTIYVTQLYAGVGRANLTPAIGAWLVGFRGRASGCTAIHDDLYATALVLASGDEKIAIVSCDLIAVHPQVVAEVRELVRSTTGIPARNVMLCCSHTHSGPPGYAAEGSRAIDRAYAAYLPFRLAGAVRLANDNLRPARLGHGSGEAAIATNRRQVIGEGRTILGTNPDGPLDREVGLLRIDSAGGDPLATLLNYACHPVTWVRAASLSQRTSSGGPAILSRVRRAHRCSSCKVHAAT